jgi:cell division protein FtsB
MADTATPNIEPQGPDTAAPERRARPRRKTDVPPRAQASARRTRIIQLVIFALAAVITIDSFVGDKGLLTTMRARREHAQKLAAIDRIRMENARMRERAKRLREDPAAIEEAARRDLGLVKPGEVLVIVRDTDKR